MLSVYARRISCVIAMIVCLKKCYPKYERATIRGKILSAILINLVVVTKIIQYSHVNRFYEFSTYWLRIGSSQEG